MIGPDVSSGAAASGSSLHGFFRHAIVLALVWLGLNGSDLRSWLVGIPAVLAAAALGAATSVARTARLRWRGVPSFAAFFLVQSARGGWDVARRVFHPRLAVAPGFVRFRTSLPEGSMRNLFATVVTLIPGTVTAGLSDEWVDVHVLDRHAEPESGLRDLERRVLSLLTPQPGSER